MGGSQAADDANDAVTGSKITTMAPIKVLNVAEKPSVAKAITQIMSRNGFNTVCMSSSGRDMGEADPYMHAHTRDAQLG